MSVFSGSRLARIESADEPRASVANCPRPASGRTEGSGRREDRGAVILDKVLNGPAGKFDHHASPPVIRESAKRPGAEGFEAALQNASRFPCRVKIGIKLKGKILLIDSADVVAVEAQGNYSLLRRKSDSYLVRASISTLAEKFAPLGFVQIHRSVLVNASWVEELRPWVTGEYVLRLERGNEYTVSRTYRNNLKRLAQAWVGADYFAG
jgi:two-component system LytT family response regulator